MMAQLMDLACLMRSKNAGPFLTTIDVMLPDAETYRHVRDSGVITDTLVAKLLGVDPGIVKIHFYEPALAIKVTVPRVVGVGDPADNDMFAGQVFGPLTELELPDMPARVG